jgi:hypothetical protein
MEMLLREISIEGVGVQSVSNVNTSKRVYQIVVAELERNLRWGENAK